MLKKEALFLSLYVKCNYVKIIVETMHKSLAKYDRIYILRNLRLFSKEYSMLHMGSTILLCIFIVNDNIFIVSEGVT